MSVLKDHFKLYDMGERLAATACGSYVLREHATRDTRLVNCGTCKRSIRAKARWDKK